jgi:hypothetical protein
MAENKSDIQKPSQADEEFDKSIDDIAALFLAEEGANYEGKLESYEVHAQKVRKEVHESMEEFRDRFLKGYELLLKELSQQYQTAAGKGDIPPNAIKL